MTKPPRMRRESLLSATAPVHGLPLLGKYLTQQPSSQKTYPPQQKAYECRQKIHYRFANAQKRCDFTTQEAFIGEAFGEANREPYETAHEAARHTLPARRHKEIAHYNQHIQHPTPMRQKPAAHRCKPPHNP